MSTIIFELSCGSTVQILKVGDWYQLAEVFDFKPARLVGGLHSKMLGAIDAVREFDLTKKERNTLEEIKHSIVSTNNTILDLLKQQSEHLAHL